MWFLLVLKFLAAGSAVFGKHIVNWLFDIYEYFEDEEKNDPKT